MSIYKQYSHYYDLLYRNKDYSGEANYIHEIIQQFYPRARSILNLGCGTGSHDVLLCHLGYTVTGVDMSEEMLAMANFKLSDPSLLNLSLQFHQGDIRNFRLGTYFDVVTSLFHVMSYQTKNIDIMEVISTAKNHVIPNGLFIFDCWYGPAVLTDRPVVRVKRLEDDTVSIVRIAEPTIYPSLNLVDVRYTVFISDKIAGTVQVLNETHSMRYLFTPEMEMMLTTGGFKILMSEEWMTKKALDCDTWGALFVCQAVS